MGQSNRDKEIEAATYYYDTIIESFQDVLLEYEEEEKFEDCAIIMELIEDLQKEKRLIEIAEITGRGIKR